jgi:RNA polymerase sigma-70 factor (ECF subfamily)
MATSDEDEEDLLASLGEPARFAAIFERHVVAIHRYLSYRVGTDLADDLSAETFLRAFRGRDHFDSSKGSVRAWLFGIATNLVSHHRRDTKRCLRLDRKAASEQSPLRRDSDFAESVTGCSDLARAIGQLDRKLRDVVLLVAGVGLSYEEAAVALSIPVGTVRSRLSRARDQVRAQLDPGRDRLKKGAEPL